jgi:hypothetical protein
MKPSPTEFYAAVARQVLEALEPGSELTVTVVATSLVDADTRQPQASRPTTGRDLVRECYRERMARRQARAADVAALDKVLATRPTRPPGAR